MFMSFKAAQDVILIKIYESIYTKDDNEYFFISEIRELCDDQFSTLFAKKVTLHLVELKNLAEKYFPEDQQSGYTITAKGISAAERLYVNSGELSPSLTAVPAADRIVLISDNQSKTDQMVSAVETAEEAIRTSNTLDEAQKSWIRIHLESGLGLLKKGKAISTGAIKSLIISPLNAAFRAVSEEQIKKLIEVALAAVRSWLGY